jgi:hypothetical protein
VNSWQFSQDNHPKDENKQTIVNEPPHNGSMKRAQFGVASLYFSLVKETKIFWSIVKRIFPAFQSIYFVCVVILVVDKSTIRGSILIVS